MTHFRRLYSILIAAFFGSISLFGQANEQFLKGLSHVHFNPVDHELKIELETHGDRASKKIVKDQANFDLYITSDGQKEKISNFKLRPSLSRDSKNDIKNILVVLDVGGSMTEEDLTKGYDLITNGIQQLSSRGDAAITYSVLNDRLEICGGQQRFKNFLETQLTQRSETSDFRQIFLNQRIEQTDIIVLISDGYFSKNTKKKKEGFPGSDDFKNSINSFGSLNIYTIGLGYNSDFLLNIPEWTKDLADNYSNKGISGHLQKELSSTNFQYSNKLYLTVPNYVIKDRNPEIGFTYLDGFNVPFTSIDIPIRMPSYYGVDFIESMKLPLIISLALLALIFLALPVYTQYKFKKENIFNYGDVKKKNVTNRDPLTLAPLECNDQVVMIGEKMMLLDTWRYLKKSSDADLAKDHSEFFKSDVETSLFKHNDTRFKALYWIWFGIIGSTVGWAVFEAIEFFLNVVVENFAFTAASFKPLANVPFVHNVLLSLVFPFILIALFTGFLVAKNYVSSGIDLAKYIGLSLVGFLGINFLGSMLVHFLGLKGILSDVVFVVLNGIVFLALLAFVSKKNLKGLIKPTIMFFVATAIGFLIIPQFVSSNLIIRYISCLLTGIGGGLAVASLFEFKDKYALRVLSPEGFRGIQTELIEKELKGKKSYDVGRNPNANIYVKWIDFEIKEEHAALKFMNGNYVIFPQDGSLYVNNKEVFDQKILKPKDVISFGPSKVTELVFDIFIEKSQNPTKPSAKPGKKSLKEENVAVEPKDVKTQIKINKISK